tara:strand:+ start:450 stop:863 length:414 start_codon:yes stop_codon:yes gene_type:complete
MIKIYTDGACKGNPGPGGYGVHIIYPHGRIEELYGREEKTTNNMMELQATIEALAHFEKEENITIYTDSNYVKKGITEWIHNWKRNGWKNSKKQPVKNKELWKELDQWNGFHQVSWKWVKGHSGDPANERADYLATF